MEEKRLTTKCVKCNGTAILIAKTKKKKSYFCPKCGVITEIEVVNDVKAAKLIKEAVEEKDQK